MAARQGGKPTMSALQFARRGPLALLLLALCLTPALAQNGDIPPEKGFRRSRVFTMPFSLPSADKQRTQQIKLFVKPEPGGEWQVHATASPAQLRYDARSGLEVGEFDVRLDRDGLFNFAVMTVFADGRSEPASPDQLRPDMRMVVDTRPPTITLKPLQSRAKGDGNTIVGVEWRVEDENLNRNSIRLEGRWY